MRLGRLAARRPVGLADLAAYLNDPLPAAPPSVKAPTCNWGMLGNDQYGDCTLAGAVHLRMANSLEYKESNETWPTTDQVVSTYLTLTHGQDAGLVEADVLHTWHTAGLFGNRIDGYAPLDHRDEDELRSCVATFGGAYLGIAVPATAQTQFGDGQPWDLTGYPADRQIVGGHCVPACGYDSDYLYVVTWGKVQKVTWRWLAVYLEEGWAVGTSELFAAAGVDVVALRADLASLGAAA